MYLDTSKTYYVYILSNRSKSLYIGITSKLRQRVFEHKEGSGSEFTAYKLDRLVYFERYSDVHRAIAREKQLKGWRRLKKIALIVALNPAWRDLSEGWYERHQFEPEVHRSPFDSLPSVSRSGQAFDSAESFASE